MSKIAGLLATRNVKDTSHYVHTRAILRLDMATFLSVVCFIL